MSRKMVVALVLASFAAGGLSVVAALRVRRAWLPTPALTDPDFPDPAPHPAGPPRVVVAGNSLASGYLLGEPEGFPGCLARTLGPSRVVTRAVGGQATARMVEGGPAIDALLVAGQGTLVVWEGSNDIHFGATGDEAADRLAAYCKARREAGWRVVLLTILPRDEGAGSPGFEAARDTANARLRTGWRGFADAIADVAADPRIGRPDATGDRRYYLPDRAHLAPLGASVAADHAAAAALSLD